MGRSKSTDSAPPGSPQASPDKDAHVTLRKALWAVQNDWHDADMSIEHVEIDVSAAGEVTYRVRAPRSEETDGGYVAKT